MWVICVIREDSGPEVYGTFENRLEAIHHLNQNMVKFYTEYSCLDATVLEILPLY